MLEQKAVPPQNLQPESANTQRPRTGAIRPVAAFVAMAGAYFTGVVTSGFWLNQLNRLSDTSRSALTALSLNSEQSIKDGTILAWQVILEKLPEGRRFLPEFERSRARLLLDEIDGEPLSVTTGYLRDNGELRIDWKMVRATIAALEALNYQADDAVIIAAALSLPTLVHELSHQRDTEAIGQLMGDPNKGFHRSLESEIIARHEGARIAHALCTLEFGPSDRKATLISLASLVPLYGGAFQSAFQEFTADPGDTGILLRNTEHYGTYPRILTDNPEEWAATLKFVSFSERTLIELCSEAGFLDEFRDHYRDRFEKLGGEQEIVRRAEAWRKALEAFNERRTLFPGHLVLNAWNILTRFPSVKAVERRVELRAATATMFDSFEETVHLAPFTLDADNLRAFEILCQIHEKDISSYRAYVETIRDDAVDRLRRSTGQRYFTESDKRKLEETIAAANALLGEDSR